MVHLLLQVCSVEVYSCSTPWTLDILRLSDLASLGLARLRVLHLLVRDREKGGASGQLPKALKLTIFRGSVNYAELVGRCGEVVTPRVSEREHFRLDNVTEAEALAHLDLVALRQSVVSSARKGQLTEHRRHGRRPSAPQSSRARGGC